MPFYCVALFHSPPIGEVKSIRPQEDTMTLPWRKNKQRDKTAEPILQMTIGSSAETAVSKIFTLERRTMTLPCGGVVLYGLSFHSG